jgi:hypothetical protein
LKNILEKEYNSAFSLFFGDTIRQKKKRKNPKEPSKLSQLPNIYEWVLKNFLVSCF